MSLTAGESFNKQPLFHNQLRQKKLVTMDYMY